MNSERILSLLKEVESGKVSVEAALDRLRHLPFEAAGDLTLDHHRELRCGFPEVVLAEGKRPEQVEEAAGRILARDQRLLVTRVDPEVAARLLSRFPEVEHDPVARAVFRKGASGEPAGRIAVLCAGTADRPIAAEAELTASLFGHEVHSIVDVGVAGLHRLLPHLPLLREQDALVVVAGMEGALPSVVGGLVDCPVVAVPTSVGYGASLGGITALLGMLSSCVAGVTVVNIDNGFGGGYAAGLIARRRRRGEAGERR